VLHLHGHQRLLHALQPLAQKVVEGVYMGSHQAAQRLWHSLISVHLPAANALTQLTAQRTPSAQAAGRTHSTPLKLS